MLYCLLFLLSWTGESADKQMHLTGIYELVAVLTHKGRSADSGHYVAWVKQEKGQVLSPRSLLSVNSSQFVSSQMT